MTIEHVLSRLSEPLLPKTLAPHWEETAQSDAGIPDFLAPETVRRNRELSGLPPEADAVLLETAARIAAHPELRILARHAHRLLYEYDDYSGFASWPSFENTLGPRGGVFWLLIALDAAPRVDRLHAALGVPESIRAATRDRSDGVGLYRAVHNGAWGADRRSLYWLRHHFQGRLFRIGRMEYKIEPYNGHVSAWRRTSDRAVVAFAPDGVRVQPDGHIHAAAPGAVDATGWTATFRAGEDTIEGYPVSPDGYILDRPISLPRAEWESALKEGDFTMDMHIPPGGGMTLERSIQSMRDADRFFREFFPDKPCASITCASWIFNTQLERILPSSANLVRYQRELYLYPVPSGGRDGLVFIFDRDTFDPATAPRDTSLQRAVADFIAAGNRWRSGGMFFLVDDLPFLGRQHYRRQRMPVEPEGERKP